YGLHPVYPESEGLSAGQRRMADVSAAIVLHDKLHASRYFGAGYFAWIVHGRANFGSRHRNPPFHANIPEPAVDLSREGRCAAFRTTAGGVVASASLYLAVCHE